MKRNYTPPVTVTQIQKAENYQSSKRVTPTKMATKKAMVTEPSPIVVESQENYSESNGSPISPVIMVR
jgi:hypothetical protein